MDPKERKERKKFSGLSIMPQFHVRYTPYALGRDVKEWCEHILTQYPNAMICAHEELKQDTGPADQRSLHYHIYLDIECHRKTVVNHLTQWFKIPSGLRGKENAYYMVKVIETCGGYTPQYVLGYVQEDGKLIFTNISPNRLMEALETYKRNRPKKTDPGDNNVAQATSFPGSPVKAQQANEAIQDQYLEYLRYMKTQIANNLITNALGASRYREHVDYKWVAKKTRAYYAGRGIGLLETKAKMSRFSASFYYEFLTKMDNHTTETAEEFDNIGY